MNNKKSKINVVRYFRLQKNKLHAYAANVSHSKPRRRKKPNKKGDLKIHSNDSTVSHLGVSLRVCPRRLRHCPLPVGRRSRWRRGAWAEDCSVGRRRQREMGGWRPERCLSRWRKEGHSCGGALPRWRT